MTALWVLLGAVIGAVIVGVALRAQLQLTRTHAARAEQLQRELREREARVADVQHAHETRVTALQREHDARVSEMQRELTDARIQATALRERLEHERASAAEKLALLDDAQRKLSDAFRVLSADA